MYFNSLFNLDDWNPDAEYIIFDDFPWDQLKRWMKQFFGAQYEFVLTDKYRKKKTVKWGKPCIFLGNDDNDPKMQATPLEWQWLEMNVFYHTLTSRLYE